MSSAIGRSVTGALQSMSGNFSVQGQVTAGLSATVVPLGGVTQPHAAWFHNTDTVNFVTIFNGASGAVLCRLLAGEAYPIPLDPACVPYVKADTAPVIVEYLICSL